LKEEVISLREKLTTSEENLKTLKSFMVAYIQMKEGHIPHELGVMFGNASNVIVSALYFVYNLISCVYFLKLT